MLYDVLILGGGPAGYTAGLYCRRANLNVILLEKFSPGGQMATTDHVDNYPGFPEGINGFDLALKMKEGAERFGLETVLAEAEEVHLAEDPKRIVADGKTYLARSVILATGASPRELGIPGERELRGRGVSYCATCDGMFYRGKDVAIVGGGNTAAEDALYLARICRKVYLVHRRDQLRATDIYRQALEKCPNVEFVWNSQVISLQADQMLSGITLRNVQTGQDTELEVQGLFVAIGITPNTGLYKNQLDMDKDGFLIADETTQTNLPGVYAIGDLRQKPLRQIVTAVADGAVAVQFAQEYLG